MRRPYCADRMCGALDCSTCYGRGDDEDNDEEGASFDLRRCCDCHEPYTASPTTGLCEHCKVQSDAWERGELHWVMPRESGFYDDELPW